mmetsp:Transcript_102512/g.295114  ORF Transcript_102512/g.295114 Transcript_102512/m.295114 type:complete len:207 (+) Transcript_102512:684-1304(+)
MSASEVHEGSAPFNEKNQRLYPAAWILLAGSSASASASIAAAAAVAAAIAAAVALAATAVARAVATVIATAIAAAIAAAATASSALPTTAAAATSLSGRAHLAEVHLALNGQCAGVARIRVRPCQGPVRVRPAPRTSHMRLRSTLHVGRPLHARPNLRGKGLWRRGHCARWPRRPPRRCTRPRTMDRQKRCRCSMEHRHQRKMCQR